MNVSVKAGLGIFICCQLMVLAACSGDVRTEIPDHLATIEQLTVVEEDAAPVYDREPQYSASFGDTDEVIIGQIGEFTVDHRGRVYIADQNQNVIHVYHPGGEYHSQVGRDGDGPGGFRRVSAIRTDDQFIHVLDTSQMRISRFDLNTFHFEDNFSIPFEWESVGGYISFPQTFYLIDSEHYLVHFGTGYSAGQDDGDGEVVPMETGRVLNRSDGTFADGTTYEFPISEAIVRREGTSLHVMSPDYKRRTMVMANDRHFVQGWSEDLLFKLYDLDGEYSHALYQPFTKPPLDRNAIVREHADRDEPWRSMIRNDDIPEKWPAFRYLVLDDESAVWAATFHEDDDIYNWRGYSSGGELIASFNWPREREIRIVRDGAIYTRETDEETGLQQVVKYNIES